MTTLTLRDLSFLSNVYHPEVVSWMQRVSANQGTASISTLDAMSVFCRSIDAVPGLRSSITRLNLFCGNQLNAALVPLYLSESPVGAAKGNTIDTNYNFIESNFSNQGLGKSNNSDAYLNTGLTVDNFGAASSAHFSVSATNCLTTSADSAFIGTHNPSINVERTLVVLDESSAYLSGTNDRAFRHAVTNSAVIVGASLQSEEKHLVGNKISNARQLFRNGSLITSYQSANTLLSHTVPIIIFGLNSSSPGAFSSATLRMYSIGNSLLASQVPDFTNAVNAFNLSLNR